MFNLFEWNAFGITNLEGRTVLDIGAADGYFSLASKAVGADKVTAVDLNYWGWPYNIEKLCKLWDTEVTILSRDFQSLE